MRDAQIAAIRWKFDALCVDSVYSKVLSSNERALNSCRLLGYDMQAFSRRPLFRKQDAAGEFFTEEGEEHQRVHGLELLYLRLTKDCFFRCVADLSA